MTARANTDFYSKFGAALPPHSSLGCQAARLRVFCFVQQLLAMLSRQVVTPGTPIESPWEWPPHQLGLDSAPASDSPPALLPYQGINGLSIFSLSGDNCEKESTLPRKPTQGVFRRHLECNLRQVTSFFYASFSLPVKGVYDCFLEKTEEMMYRKYSAQNLSWELFHKLLLCYFPPEGAGGPALGSQCHRPCLSLNLVICMLLSSCSQHPPRITLQTDKWHSPSMASATSL